MTDYIKKYNQTGWSERWSQYVERPFSGGCRFPGKTRRICIECHKTFGKFLEKCPCGGEVTYLDQRARVPRKTASKNKWKKFFAMFGKPKNQGD